MGKSYAYVFGIVAILTCTWSSAASAQVSEQAVSGALPTLEPQPRPGSGAILGTTTAAPVEPFGFAAGLSATYSRRTLELQSRTVDGELVGERALVSNRFDARIWGALGLHRSFDLALSIPTVLQSTRLTGDGSGGSKFHLGDPQLIPRWIFIGADRAEGFGMALSMPVALPIGGARPLVSSGGAQFHPRLAAEWRSAGDSVLAANLGFRQTIGGVESALPTSAVTWSAAGSYGLGASGFDLFGSLSGRLGVGSVPETLESVDERVATSLELDVGARYRIAQSPWVTELSGGRGLTAGIGSPAWRGTLQVAYSPAVQHEEADSTADTDDDGIPDDEDECADRAEDRDGDRDEDGCPDEKEEAKSEPDGDRDGIPDNQDECPEKPEDADGDRDEDGCPDEESDRVDQPADSDQDGVSDEEDQCPNEPEDEDGIEDGDGCPEKNKGDVTLSEARERVREGRILFEFDSARLRETSHAPLEQIAELIKFFSAIGTIRVEGHTDSKGPASYNRGLSKRRADSVRDFLVDQGVSPDRLETRGYGESQPIADNDTPEGRQKNRRVEFVIVAE